MKLSYVNWCTLVIIVILLLKCEHYYSSSSPLLLILMRFLLIFLLILFRYSYCYWIIKFEEIFMLPELWELLLLDNFIILKCFKYNNATCNLFHFCFVLKFRTIAHELSRTKFVVYMLMSPSCFSSICVLMKPLPVIYC